MKYGKTLTPREAAVILGCGMKRLYELLYSQKITGTKTNDRWVIPASAIESRLKQRKANHEAAQSRYASTKPEERREAVHA